MRAIILLFYLLITSGNSCKKLAFNGETFLTAKGRIVDQAGKPLSALPVSVYHSVRDTQFLVNGYLGKDAISNTTYTDANGRFQVTYPASNGYDYLMLPKGYWLDSVSPTLWDSISGQFYYLDSARFRNYLIEVSDIKIKKL
jgi:hypothetical protein